jgi:hypothetical protein
MLGDIYPNVNPFLCGSKLHCAIPRGRPKAAAREIFLGFLQRCVHGVNFSMLESWAVPGHLQPRLEEARIRRFSGVFNANAERRHERAGYPLCSTRVPANSSNHLWIKGNP